MRQSARTCPTKEVGLFRDNLGQAIRAEPAEAGAAGRLIGANELLIAARARALGLTPVTASTGEFTRIDGTKIETRLA